MEVSSHGLKDGRGYRVSDNVGLENVSPVLSDMIGKVHRTVNCDDTTGNSNVLMTDLRIQIIKEANE
jgi:hypothetical protein